MSGARRMPIPPQFRPHVHVFSLAYTSTYRESSGRATSTVRLAFCRNGERQKSFDCWANSPAIDRDPSQNPGADVFSGHRQYTIKRLGFDTNRARQFRGFIGQKDRATEDGPETILRLGLLSARKYIARLRQSTNQRSMRIPMVGR